jgi:hypothetical protein
VVVPVVPGGRKYVPVADPMVIAKEAVAPAPAPFARWRRA